MKYLIASDIHGSSLNAGKIISAFKEEKADRIILLGDILYHGPRNELPEEYNPKKVCEILNPYSNCIYAVKGNCDADIDQMVLKFPIMSSYFLLEVNGHIVFATHGDIYNLNNLPPINKNDILLHGHTHVPALVKYNDIIYINPGSVSIPKENSYNGYIILEDNTFTFKDFFGNIYNIYKVD